jgi:ADP-heptose:LPS heptosyltransferase
MSRSTGLQRVLDQHVGNLAALALALRRPAASDAEKITNPRRIGFIQPSAIGDLVVASGLFAHVHATFPHAELHLLHGTSNAAALDVLEPGLLSHTLNFTKPLAALQYVRSLGLDVLVDLVTWSTATAMICRFSGVPLTFGFAVPGQFRHFLFAGVAQYSGDVHQSENFRALASLFGPMTNYAYQLRKSFPKPDVQLPYDRLIVCHIRPGGSQARAKAWPAGRWVELAGRLCDAGYAVAFSGSRADRTAIEIVMAEVERPGRQCFILAGGMTLPEFCYVLQHSRLTITVDTSPVHLASALGVPVVGLHGASRSSQWGAVSPNSRSIDAPHPAAGYIEFGFENHPRAREIMRSISVDEVHKAASSLLTREARQMGTLMSVEAGSEPEQSFADRS